MGRPPNAQSHSQAERRDGGACDHVKWFFARKVNRLATHDMRASAGVFFPVARGVAGVAAQIANAVAQVVLHFLESLGNLAQSLLRIFRNRNYTAQRSADLARLA